MMQVVLLLLMHFSSLSHSSPKRRFRIMSSWIIETGSKVGTLNVWLNILVFIAAYLVGMLATLAIHNLLLLKLQREGTAPVFCESESRSTRFFEFIKSFAFFSSPTKFLIIILSSVLFLVFEICAENGVNSSNFCSPKRIRTDGICANNATGSSSSSKIIASCLFAQRLTWNNDKLVRTPLVQGFRPNFNGREAFSSKIVNKSLPVVLEGCRIEEMKPVPSFQAKIKFVNRKDLWGLRLSQVKDIKTGSTMLGTGDSAANPQYRSSFVLANVTGGDGNSIDATYFEYSNSPHLKIVEHAIKSPNLRGSQLEVPNLQPILRYRIGCSRCALSPSEFAKAVQVYRSTQLESSIHLHSIIYKVVDGQNITVPEPLTTPSIVRAIIAYRSNDAKLCKGETLVYRQCGVYNTLYFMPVITTLLCMVVVLFATKFLVSYRSARIEVPTTAAEWSNYSWIEVSRNDDPEGYDPSGGTVIPKDIDTDQVSIFQYCIEDDTGDLSLKAHK